jgi:two-component system response regulator AtoC
MTERVLVVDNDLSIRETFEHHLGRSGYDVRTAPSGEEALATVVAFAPGLVITDVRMPGMDGLELLRRLRSGGEDIDVAVITAHDDMRSAIAAMQSGAYDYLVKPLDLDRIDTMVRRCFRERSLRRRMHHLAGEAAEPFGLESLVGHDQRMIEIYKLIGVLTGNRATVLIRGETGTGKELIARAIHYNAPQAAEPFIAVNCTALTETLLESELFGHVRGAFTGAVASRKGCFELAGAGTIFLDEIGDTGLDLQSKLLRVLESREFYPVGGEPPRRTEARVIAATHRPLEEYVRLGRFREHLYFRLKVVEIAVPPLRERRGDIPALVERLLRRIGRELHRRTDGVSDDAMRTLVAYEWPGNVRELENTLTHAAVLSRGSVITADGLALGPRSAAEPGTDTGGLARTLDAVEWAHIERVLRQSGGNKRQAARILGISRPRLDRIISKRGPVATERD